MKDTIHTPKYIGDLIRFNYVKKYLPQRDGDKLLDVGAGMCEYKELCESKGYKYHAIDMDERSPAQKGDICNIPFPSNTFDVLLCIDVLEHVKDDKKAAKELYRVLKEDGLLILHVPLKGQKHILIPKPDEQHDHEREGYDPLELYQLFGEFEKSTYYITFDEMESVAWDLNFSIMNHIPINILDLVDKDKWDKEWVHYGGILVAQK